MIKLLIADDEPLVQIGIKSMLDWDRLGFEICGIAVNGEHALELIEETSPQIVITDIRMLSMQTILLPSTRNILSRPVTSVLWITIPSRP